MKRSKYLREPIIISEYLELTGWGLLISLITLGVAYGITR